MKTKLLVALLICYSSFSQKEYYKSYYSNGKVKEEGWIENNKKSDYWFFYYENGNKKEEGHYKNNQKTNWWIFYDEKQNIIKKSEFKSNKMDGLSIVYLKGEIIKAEQYTNGTKVKTWTNLDDFKKDNYFK